MTDEQILAAAEAIVSTVEGLEKHDTRVDAVLMLLRPIYEAGREAWKTEPAPEFMQPLTWERVARLINSIQKGQPAVIKNRSNRP